MARITLRRGLAVAALSAAPLAFMAGPAQARDHGGSAVAATLNPMKGSHGHGTAYLSAVNGNLHVKIHTTGLVPNMPHAQHIHGDTSGKHYFCPTASADRDGDGYITVEEGLPMYGNIHISLTTKGDTSPKSGLAVDRMPVADSNGVVDYDRVIPGDQLPAGTLAHLQDLHIVQHGVDANNNDKYDLAALGESTFAKSLGVSGIPAEASDVATCGMVLPDGAVETGTGSTNGPEHLGLIGMGALALVGAGGAVVARRRFAREH